MNFINLVVFTLIFSTQLPLSLCKENSSDTHILSADESNLVTAKALKEDFNLAKVKTIKSPDALSASKIELSKKQVSISTVAILTFLMAIATGIGSIPFFFFNLESSWQGICNGIACGVMLAASFDLVAEGKSHGNGECVVVGILLGGLFILVSQRILERLGDVSVMDLKGADARRMILIISIMTLHSFGEGSGVGVSFVGPRGFSQGLLVTIAIAVHNIPEGLAVSMIMSSRGFTPTQTMLWSTFTSLPQAIVAVPAYIFAAKFTQFLPLSMGFAAGCMIWIVFGEVMPDSLKEGNASHVASAATISVAIMEFTGILLQGLEEPPRWERFSPMILSFLFILGPFIGGVIVVAIKETIQIQSTFLSGISAGILLVLSFWRPLQLLLGNKMDVLLSISLLWSGAFLYLSAIKLSQPLLSQRGSSKGEILRSDKHSIKLNPILHNCILACSAITFHAFTEGLMLGVAAPHAEGLGAYMLLPVSLHGFPRGIAVAAALYGISKSWKFALLASACMGFASPLGAVVSMLAGLDYRGLDYWMLLACGSLLPATFYHLLPRALMIDNKRTIGGIVTGLLISLVSFSGTRILCLHTPYCRSAPEAVT